MNTIKITDTFGNTSSIATGSGTQHVKDFLCVDGEYVKGDGTHDDTTGIQNALDNAKGAIDFSNGTYKVTGTGEYCLVLTRNINLIANSTRWNAIRADNTPAETSVLKIAITDNFGFLDVRNWEMRNLSIFNNGGGKHAVLVKDGMQISTSIIERNNLLGNFANGGYGLCLIDNLSHSEIYLNTISDVYAKVYDANNFRKNNIFSEGVGIVMDCELGVYNNTIEDNTITNGDGAIKILNGDAIRIRNNQCEQNQVFGENTSAPSAMISILGTNRKCNNIIISENNLGGGTNVDTLIYVDNATRTVIEKNQMKASDTYDVVFTANSSYNYLEKTNTIIGNSDDIRENNVIKVLDNGFSNFGVSQSEEPTPDPEEPPVTPPAPTVVVNDDFNRANNTTLGNAITGQTWTTVNNNFKILSNKACLKSDSQDYAVIDSTKSNCLITCKLGSLGAYFARNLKIVFRYVDQNNHYWITPFDLSGMNYSLYKRVNGVDTSLFGTTYPYATGDVIDITLNGTSIQINKNGSPIITTTLPNDFLTATKHGMYLYSSYESFDEFKVTTL